MYLLIENKISIQGSVYGYMVKNEPIHASVDRK